MAPIRRIFNPLGICMYCLRSEPDGELTKEHFIPESLYGLDYLPKSSCSDCCREFTSVDGYLSGHVYYKLRLRVGIKTKRKSKKKHPKTLVATGYVNGVLKEVESPVNSHPFGWEGFYFPRPRILRQLPPAQDFGLIHGYTVTFMGDSFRSILDPKPGQVYGFVEERKINFFKLARGIAKIAYATFVAHHGYTALSENLILPVIKQNPEDLPYLFGSPSMIPEPWAETEALHHFGLRIETVAGRELVVFQIRLFATYGGGGIGPPTYEVVLGSPTPEFSSACFLAALAKANGAFGRHTDNIAD